MADILTLAEARAALGWSEGQHLDRDADLTADWLPLITELIESPRVCGKIADRVEHWRTTRTAPLTTPWAAGTVTEVWLNGTKILGWMWTAPTLTITEAGYVAGDEVTVFCTDLTTPRRVKLAAKVTLKSVYNAHTQGTATDTRPQVPDTADPDVLLPPLAWKLTVDYRRHGGFA